MQTSKPSHIEPFIEIVILWTFEWSRNPSSLWRYILTENTVRFKKMKINTEFENHVNNGYQHFFLMLTIEIITFLIIIDF